MTTSLKDVDSAVMVGKLADMNAFPKEHNAWGYAFMAKDGKVHYCLSEESMTLRRLRDSQREAGVPMSPLVQFSERAIVRDEDYDDWIYVRKLRLADSIRKDYGHAFFDIQKRLIDASCDSLAMGILLPWKEEITGYFDEVSLDLFEGVLHEARRMRHITDEQYRELGCWLRQEKKQSIPELGGTGLYARTFRGIAYKDNGQTKYLVNANADAFYDRYDELDEQNIDKTPIYSCTLRHINSIPGVKWRQEFLEYLKEYMDDEYMARIDALNALPSSVPVDLWEESLTQADAECSEPAREALRHWGAQMRIA